MSSLPVGLPSDLTDLLQQVASGDERAFKRLYDAYSGRLYSYIARIVKSDQVAEELVMDVFMKIWRGRTLLTQIQHFDAFLFRVAYNKSIDFLRAAARDARLKTLLTARLGLAQEEQADAAVLFKEFEERLREAIDLLSPQRRKVYDMRRSLDYTHDQIAEKLHISRATVNNHIVEAHKFIRAYLASELFESSALLAVLAFFFHAA